jgi:hypothetical protein
VSRRTLELTEQGQVTDRYTKAIEQLGSEKLDVRIGGIYALKRIARDSARVHPTVMEVLTAFIREHSHEQWPPSGQGQSTRPDIQAALTVVGRRDPHRDIRPIELASAALAEADLAIRISPARTWPTGTSPARTSTVRTSPARTSDSQTSPARTSTVRSSSARSSTAQTSLTRLTSRP